MRLFVGAGTGERVQVHQAILGAEVVLGKIVQFQNDLAHHFPALALGHGIVQAVDDDDQFLMCSSILP